MKPVTWNSSYDWTKQQVLEQLALFEDSDDEKMNFDMEHTSAKNEEDVVLWCTEAGYEAENDWCCEVVRVRKIGR